MSVWNPARIAVEDDFSTGERFLALVVALSLFASERVVVVACVGRWLDIGIEDKREKDVETACSSLRFESFELPGAIFEFDVLPPQE